MLVLALVALFSSEPVISSSSRTVFSIEEVVSLSQATKRECGYASPQDLMILPANERQKILPCFIQTTVKRASLPKTIGPGATIVSVSNFQGLPVFVLRFAKDHPRASVPKNQTSKYDDQLSNRTCDDKWLGGLIDAGMVDEVQDGDIIVYKLETENGEVLTIIAVAHCLNAK